MTTLDIQAPPRDYLCVLDLAQDALTAPLDLAATMKERRHGFVLATGHWRLTWHGWME
jgi:hypothetical protein